tara:strand:- start:462 stop:1193 length:732 start_codon:yes stop_codon:yes gene_type:complete
MNLNKRWTREEAVEKFGDSENELHHIALQTSSTKITDPECSHYCDFYAQYFKDRKNDNLKILEIGVKEGDSLLMWKEYFPNSSIVGLEINPEPLKSFSHDRIKLYFGDQTDTSLLQEICKNEGPFDIIIDDASHVNEHHQVSFAHLFENGLANNGIYVIEDLGTSYWSPWGGGLKKKDSTIEFMKELVDSVNFRFHKGERDHYVGIPKLSENDLTYFDLNVTGVSFHKGMCFVQKGVNPVDIE